VYCVFQAEIAEEILRPQGFPNLSERRESRSFRRPRVTGILFFGHAAIKSKKARWKRLP